MFTGLVEEMGTISQLLRLDSSTTGGQGASLTISSCPIILSDARIGDSIACNGTCLTITELLLNQESTSPAAFVSPTSATSAAPAIIAPANPIAFKVTIAPETLRRTNLGSVRQGMKLNLERAARGDTRMGGHYVQGHVDAVAEIRDVREDGNAVVYRVSPRSMPAQPDDTSTGSGDALMKYIVEKGYISIDGASLTVTAEGADWWEVMLIPYTRERIVMGSKGVGDEVNVEVDMVGKYVEKSVKAYFENGGAGLPGLESAIKKVLAR